MIHVVLRSRLDAMPDPNTGIRNKTEFQGYDIDDSVGHYGGFKLDPAKEWVFERNARGGQIPDPTERGEFKKRPCTEAELMERADYYASLRHNWQSLHVEDPSKPIFLSAEDQIPGSGDAVEEDAGEGKITMRDKAQLNGTDYYLALQAKVKECIANGGPKIKLSSKVAALEEYLKGFGLLET